MLRPNLLNLFVATALGVVAAPVLAVDSGDAPASYGDATHEVVGGAPQLGQVAPDNNGPVFSTFADGDDLSEAIDDEDGVFAFPDLLQNTKSYTTNVFYQNTTGSPAFVSGWVDFDGNGTFDADEFATAEVPPSAPGENPVVKLEWPTLTGIATDFIGPTFARFRISSQPIGPDNMVGFFLDGEVEDYGLQVIADFDGDEIPDIDDLDNDNDGIPDAIEGDVDTDGDFTVDRLDFDSDGDGIPDFIEAGENALIPADTDGDGIADFLDLDSNNDGTPDSVPLNDDSDADGIPDGQEGNGDDDGDGVLNINDIDSDNDAIPDGVEFGPGPVARDTDSDGIPDFLDLDSDNDGIPDIRESNLLVLPVDNLDVDNDGRFDSNLLFGANGLADDAETDPDSGVLIFAIPDIDEDGTQDFLDLDSDADGITDALETGASDDDADGIVDNGVDGNGDGLFDGPINFLFADGFLPDNDSDFRPDFQDQDADGSVNGPVSGVVTVPVDPVDPVDPVTPPVAPPVGGDVGVPGVDGRIETGLNGFAGCSIDGKGSEAVLPVLAMISLLMLALRRRMANPLKLLKRRVNS